MAALINRLVLSNLAHRPVRTALSILAIAVEVTMILTLVGVSYGTLDGTARRARGVGADIMIRPPGSSLLALSTAPMSDLLVGLVSKQPHVALATGTVIQPLSGFDSITGLDLDSFSKMSGGFHYLRGGPFKTDQDMLVDEYYAKEKGLQIGDKVQLINHEWNVAGIFESGKLARICVRLPVLQELVPASLTQETIYVWWPIAGAIAIGGSLLGVIVPAIRAVKQDATEALSYD
jgi:putative ABC transport system permease protein